MSKFFTAIPVDVKAIASLLPAGCYLEKVSWNPETSAVDIHWEHDRLQTPFTYAREFPAEALKDNKLPEGVKLRESVRQAHGEQTAALSPDAATEKPPVPTQKPKAIGPAPGAKAKGRSEASRDRAR